MRDSVIHFWRKSIFIPKVHSLKTMDDSNYKKKSWLQNMKVNSMYERILKCQQLLLLWWYNTHTLINSLCINIISLIQRQMYMQALLFKEDIKVAIFILSKRTDSEIFLSLPATVIPKWTTNNIFLCLSIWTA